MNKEEYIEHCRALFENPLMSCSYIYISPHSDIYITNCRTYLANYRGLEVWYQSDELYKTIGSIDDVNFDWQDSLVSRTDFEQGGKYYKPTDSNTGGGE